MGNHPTDQEIDRSYFAYEPSNKPDANEMSETEILLFVNKRMGQIEYVVAALEEIEHNNDDFFLRVIVENCLHSPFTDPIINKAMRDQIITDRQLILVDLAGDFVEHCDKYPHFAIARILRDVIRGQIDD